MNKTIPATPSDRILPRWFAALITGAAAHNDRWWPTDGKLMLSVGESWGRVSTIHGAALFVEDQRKVWSENAPSDPATPTFPYLPDGGGALRTDLRPCVAQARYVICVERVHPGAKWLTRGELDPMWATKDGELVAILMPMRATPQGAPT